MIIISSSSLVAAHSIVKSPPPSYRMVFDDQQTSETSAQAFGDDSGGSGGGSGSQWTTDKYLETEDKIPSFSLPVSGFFFLFFSLFTPRRQVATAADVAADVGAATVMNVYISRLRECAMVYCRQPDYEQLYIFFFIYLYIRECAVVVCTFVQRYITRQETSVVCTRWNAVLFVFTQKIRRK